MKRILVILVLLIGFSIPSFGDEVLITPLINYLCETKDPDSSDYVVIMETIGEDKKKQLFGVLMRTMEIDETPEIDPYYIKLNLYNFVDRGSNKLIIVGHKTLRQITINRGNGNYIHNYIINYDEPEIREIVSFEGKCKEVEIPKKLN